MQPDVESLVALAFRTADRLTLIQLIFVTIALKVSSQYITKGKTRTIATVVGGVVLSLYFFHRFTFRDEFPDLFDTLLRSLLLHQISVSVMTIIVDIVVAAQQHVHEFCRSLTKAAGSFAKYSSRIVRGFFRKPPKYVPLPPGPTYEEQLQLFAQKAKKEHDAELHMLESLPLDRDEREVLEMHAKRKLLKKLRDR